MKKALFSSLLLLCLYSLSGQTWQEARDQAVALYEKGEFAAALPEAEKALALAEQAFGAEHENYVESTHILAELHNQLGQYDKALPLFEAMVALAEKTAGKDNVQYGYAISGLAGVYHSMGAYDKALPLLLAAVENAEKWLGKDDPEYGSRLYSLANLYYYKGEYDKALPIFIASVENAEKSLGKDNPEYGSRLNGLASVYHWMGAYDKALALFVESVANAEKHYGKRHPEYISRLGKLATLYEKTGAYDKALALFTEALETTAGTRGKDHPDYGLLQNNLVVLYYAMAEYDKAIEACLESLANGEKNLGKDHSEYGVRLNNLAQLYLAIGQFDKALPLNLQALDNTRGSLGVQHSEYGIRLNNLAALYEGMGEYDKALQLYLESIENTISTFGKHHSQYGNRLINLAYLYRKMGAYDKALPLYHEAIDNVINTLGKEHASYGAYLSSLALLHNNLGEHDKALPLLQEAAAVTAKAVGVEHPKYEAMLNYLSMAYAAVNDYAAALQPADSAQQLMRKLLTRAVKYTSERDLAAYLKRESANLAHIPSWLHSGLFPEQLNEMVCNDMLFQKGFLLHAAARLRRLSAASPEADSLSSLLRSYYVQLSRAYAKPPAQRTGIAELEAKTDALEAFLSRTVAGYAEALQQVNWKEVQATLRADELAIEFIHFPVLFPRNTDSIMYGALLIRPGYDAPRYVPLFEESALRQLLAANVVRKSAYANGLYGWADPSLLPPDSVHTSLYELVWKNIGQTGLEGVKTVYYAPSGVLHRLNLGALALDEKTVLANRYRLIALNSTRQLVVPAHFLPAAEDAVLIGGVEYNLATNTTAAAEQPVLSAGSRSIESSWTEGDSRSAGWKTLRWTSVEVDRIASLLHKHAYATQKLSGSAATEEAFKELGRDKPSPRILHIATHGFFFPDPVTVFPEVVEARQRPFKWSEHPMIRSGLIMAGANYAWEHGHPLLPEQEDGVLTAYEISQMNLSNTELVVLSACETGLGDLQGNEGVYGLQRAFRIAGAKYLIMSLWQVPDQQTMEFMSTFYRFWLDEGMQIPDAFRKTQEVMRELFVNPYAWAGFVLIE